MVALLVVAHLIGAVLLAYGANWVGLIPWRAAAQAHWTERARLVWPARVTAVINVFLIPALLNRAQALLFPETGSWWIVNGAAALVGALLGCYPGDREMFPELDFRAWRHQVVAGWGIRFGIMAALLIALILMPSQVGPAMGLVVGVYLVFHFALQWGLFLKYLRWVRFLTPAGERLERIVNATAARLNVRVRKTWQLDGTLANAFALPTTHEVVFSNRLLDICSDEEVEAICAHEVAHLKESRAILACRLLGSLSFFPLIFLTPSVHYLGPLGLIMPYAGLFLIARFARWFSRRMEQRADQLALTEQANDGVYARALEKLYRENQMPAVNSSSAQTHPHLYDRLIAAGVTPDYPRPAKPSRFTGIGWIYLFGCGVLFGMTVFRT